MLTAQILSAAPEFKADENLKTQVLPNGMTIAVYKNSEPPNRVSMRLLVKRGSAYELENERGLAHFLEHMAFNGTKHFPAGEMVEYFQRLGMAHFVDGSRAHSAGQRPVIQILKGIVLHHILLDGPQFHAPRGMQRIQDQFLLSCRFVHATSFFLALCPANRGRARA